jgi:hypothetical protein
MIYFLQPTDGGAVKIGYSDDVDARRRQLESYHGCPPPLLATMPGGATEEAEVHERFAHLRFGSAEQFRPAPDLMAFINCPLPVGADPDAVEVIRPARVELIISLGVSLKHRIQAAADEEGNTVAAFVRTAVVEKLKRRGREAGE